MTWIHLKANSKSFQPWMVWTQSRQTEKTMKMRTRQTQQRREMTSCNLKICLQLTLISTRHPFGGSWHNLNTSTIKFQLWQLVLSTSPSMMWVWMKLMMNFLKLNFNSSTDGIMQLQVWHRWLLHKIAEENRWNMHTHIFCDVFHLHTIQSHYILDWTGEISISRKTCTVPYTKLQSTKSDIFVQNFSPKIDNCNVAELRWSFE